MKKIVITKTGFNVLSETDPNNMVFSSDYDTLKYHVSGSVDIPWTSDGVFEQTISHGLGYTPFFTAAVNPGTTVTDQYSLAPYRVADIGVSFEVTIYADSTKIYLTVKTSGAGSETASLKYKIFRNHIGL